MTYNFDPDRWLETHQAALAARRDRGEIDESGYAAELDDLDRRYDAVVARLDGSFDIPPNRSTDA